MDLPEVTVCIVADKDSKSSNRFAYRKVQTYSNSIFMLTNKVKCLLLNTATVYRKKYN